MCERWSPLGGMPLSFGKGDRKAKVITEQTLKNSYCTSIAPSPRPRITFCALQTKTFSVFFLSAFLLLLTFASDARVYAAARPWPSLPINSSGQIESVIVSIPNGGLLTNIRVLTQGIPNADFTLTSPGTCVVGTSYAAFSSCTVSISFGPKAPGTRLGAVVLMSGTGSVLGEQVPYRFRTRILKCF